MFQSHHGLMMSEDVILGYAKLEVKDIQELSLDAPNISFVEESCAHRPVNVL